MGKKLNIVTRHILRQWFMFCEPGLSGMRFRAWNLTEFPLNPFTKNSCNGLAAVFLKSSGRPGWPSTTNWRGSPGNGSQQTAPIPKRQWHRKRSAPAPPTGGKNGSKRHLLVDERGIPLSIVVTAANRNDCVVLDELLEKRISPAAEVLRPVENLCMDAGYVGKSQTAVSNGFVPHIRPRGEEKKLIEKNNGFKARRWVVELGHSWYNRFRKIHVRYEKEEVSFLGLVQLASAIIVFNRICSVYPI